MTFNDRRLNSRPTQGEAPFGLDEVFISRTDDRGVIKAANHVFKRVAHYEWDELLGAPHRIIRHPDMPKGVFQLLWDTLKRGECMGAYVKNKTKDGLYYWVFAVVVPCPGGFLSARLRPSSAIFEDVQKAYADLLQAEKDDELSPEDSAEVLKGWIQSKGFENYHHFATTALTEELLSRSEALHNAPDKKILQLRQTVSDAGTLVTETEALIKEFDGMRTIPHNLRVIASRIEPAGGPVTVLSQNYGSMSAEMSNWFEANVMGENSNFNKIKDAVSNRLFVEGMTRVLEECADLLTQERRQLGNVDIEKERKILADLVKRERQLAGDGGEQINFEADRIQRACNIMHRQFLGLSTTRVLCKIEAARLPKDGETLDDIINQLGDFQRCIAKRLHNIAKLSEQIRAIE
ncbi:PAS domain-containing protein [Pseudophaeobacter sp.]|uniref:PAS domain-containing protein n=1 Tax=Pseudophaeobacter sp. TaxID=1971739 RepID=UPI003298F034